MDADENTKRFYLTTPIYYVNARPHLGTAYTTIIADIIARYKRMLGFDVLLVTGSDENSQKIVLAAGEAGMDPREFCDEMVERYHQAWRMLDIGPYEFVRTTEERHRKLVQHFFGRIYEQGYIYKGEYSGHYCTPCETFYTEKELLPGELCPKCERPTHEVAEEAYFFKLSAFQDFLRDLLSPEREFVIPDFRLNEMRARVDEGLSDVCISRSSLQWGIPLPWDETHVIYVWVDALLAYVTGSGFDFEHPEKPHYWPAQLNLMAKDIPWFHAIIFPAMLHAYSKTFDDTAPPRLGHVEQMLVHGYWLYGESKMSKSRGVAISPQEVVRLVRADGLRYFFAREVPLGLDGTISLEAIVNRYNYDLGNDLGNLVNRLLTMTNNYFGGVVPEAPEYRDTDRELQALVAAKREEALRFLERYEFSRGLEEVFTIIKECNRFIDARKPWVLGKQPARASEFTGAFCALFDALKTVAVLLLPVMPAAMQELWEQIGLPGRVEEGGIAEAAKSYPRGNRVGQGKPLFPRVEITEEKTPTAPPAEVKQPSGAKEKQMADMIEFSDFQKVEIIVAKILSAELVPGADKLVKMQMDDGRGGRQTVAGIAPWVKPEELVGLYVPIIANLKPAKLRGELSEGMMLAAQDGQGNLSLVVMQQEIAPGSKVV